MDKEVRVTRNDLGNTEFDKILVGLGIIINDLASYTAVTMTVSQVYFEFSL